MISPLIPSLSIPLRNMVSRFVCPMDNHAHKNRKRMRRYLFTWIAGCTALIVVAYTQLLDYYLDLGVKHFCVGTDISILHNWWKEEGEALRKAVE